MGVLDPQWIVDSFACIIRDFSLHTKAGDRCCTSWYCSTVVSLPI